MSMNAEVLAGNRAAVEELLVAADRGAATWSQPRAAGKWSPAQTAEHVARALEESGKVIAGQPSVFPSFPRILRPLLRVVFFRKVLKTGLFPGGARTNKAMNPEHGPPSVAEARVRLEGALSMLERATLARGDADQGVDSGVFGMVPLAEYLRFQELHTRHHRRQLPAG